MIVMQASGMHACIVTQLKEKRGNKFASHFVHMILTKTSAFHRHRRHHLQHTIIIIFIYIQFLDFHRTTKNNAPVSLHKNLHPLHNLQISQRPMQPISQIEIKD